MKIKSWHLPKLFLCAVFFMTLFYGNESVKALEEGKRPVLNHTNSISGQQAIDLVKGKLRNPGMKMDKMIFSASFHTSQTLLREEYKVIKYGKDEIIVPKKDEHPERHTKGYWEVTYRLRDGKPCAPGLPGWPTCSWETLVYHVDMAGNIVALGIH